MIEELLGNQTFHIMVVDDNQMVRQLIKKRLEKLGYKVSDFEDGNEAIEQIRSGLEVDTILLDIQMPKISGIEVLKEVRKMKSLNELPIIMVSALEENKAVLEALQLGANDYITKPVDFPIAIARLKTTLAVKFTDTVLKQQSARSAAQAKLSSLGEMASGMAHEINNPLAVVVGTSQILEKMLPKLVNEQNTEKVEKLCKRITQSSQRVSTVIRYLREFSQPVNPEGQPLFADFLATDIIEQLQDISSVKARAKKTVIDFNTDIENDLSVNVDKAKLVHAVFALVENAIDATAQCEQPKIRVHTFSDSNFLYIKISDNGPGISPEIQGKIYEPFFTTKDVGEGMGMGLSSAKGILDSLKAELSNNRENELTHFVVKLPISESSLSKELETKTG